MRRYVHGPGVDEPLVAYDGAGTGSRHWLLADERGSVVGSSDAAGSVASAVLDDYGQGAPVSRFGFTGQAWLPEAGVYHFKARAYSPRLGRFLQPDPSADPDSPSLYAYAGNDSVNRSDPQGLAGCENSGNPTGCIQPRTMQEFVVTARMRDIDLSGWRSAYTSRSNQSSIAVNVLPQGSIPAGAGRKSYFEAEKIARQIAAEELMRTRRITRGYKLGGHNDLYDAERHARWAYRMSIEVGSGWAGAFATGHEISEVFGQPLIEMRMDLSNNALGLEAAINGRGIPNMSTPGLVYIRQGQLVGGK